MKIEDINESYTKIILTDENEEKKKEIIDYLTKKLTFPDPSAQYTFSYQTGQWDGYRRFYKRIKNGIIIPKGFKYLVKEDEEVILDENKANEYIETLKLPFEPREYQLKAFITAINKKRVVLLSATSSGKSLVIYLISRYLMDQGKKGVLIVPNVGLVEQMRLDFIDYSQNNGFVFDENCHIIYSGYPKHFDKQFTITTWQSVRKDLELFEDIDFILIDETHLAKAVNINKILVASVNSEYKIGLTGTMPENILERAEIIGAIGKVEKIISAQGLVELGYATPVEIYCVFMKYSYKIARMTQSILRKARAKSPQSSKAYAAEIDFINSLPMRNKVIRTIIMYLTKKYGNSIALYTKTSQGEEVAKYILAKKIDAEPDEIFVCNKLTSKQLKECEEKGIKYIFTQTKTKMVSTICEIMNMNDYGVYLMRGDVDGKMRNKIREIFEKNNNIILIASYQVASTGINIKNLHNIFLLSTTKSPIRLNQTIGRGMRKHDSKEKMRLIDFVDDMSVVYENYSLKHFEKRFYVYQEQEYPLYILEVGMDGKEVKDSLKNALKEIK